MAIAEKETHAGVLPGSWLDHVLQDRELLYADGTTVPRYITGSDGMPTLVVGLDNGNDAIKLTLMRADRTALYSTRTVTAHSPAIKRKRGSTGRALESWVVDGKAAFHIGETAMAQEGRSLPIGQTPERLNDQRFRSFLGAVLVDGLRQAGYKAGTYQLCIGFGVPNEEVSIGGIDQQTREALQALKGHTFKVVRRDERRNEEKWEVSVGGLIPASQSTGTFYAWFSDLTGNAVSLDRKRITILDIGGGHLQQFDITIYPEEKGFDLRGVGEMIGEGTVVLARMLRDELRDRYDSKRLTEVEAQRVLVTGIFRRGGYDEDIHDIIADILSLGAEDTLSRLLEPMRETESFVIFTGGGAILLGDMLRQRATQLGREEVLIIPSQVASLSNSVGLFAQALFTTLASRVNGR
jgi:hypothetical protein